MDDKTALFMRQVGQRTSLTAGLFAGIEAKELGELVALSDMEMFNPGSCVFREGEEGDSMHVVAAGRFEVFRTDHRGYEVRLAIVEQGEMFGEIALLERIRRTATVRAMTPGMTFSFHRLELGLRPDLMLKLYLNMARILAKRLRLTTDDLLVSSEQACARVESGAAAEGDAP